MAGAHPDEIDLLAYVESDLDRTQHESVSAHVETCPDCAEQVRDLERARDALRAAPGFEFPAHRSTVTELPPRAGKRRGYVSPMRLVAVLAPVAAIVALVVALTSLPTGGDEEGAGEAGDAAPAQVDAGAGAEAEEEAGATDLSAPNSRVVRRVAGPAEEVAAVLRSRGFDATVIDGAVVVRAADETELLSALASRPRGPVRVLRDPP